MTTMNSPTIFECHAGLRKHNGASALWVRSPRTGNTVTITADRFAALPPRLVPRVARAAACGHHAVAFTREELHAIAQAAKPAAPPESAIEPHVRRSFWGTPAMSKTKTTPAIPAAYEPVKSSARVEQVTITLHRLPAIIGTEGIHNHPFLCITLSDRHVTFRPNDWPRLPAGIIERVKAAKTGELVEFTSEEITAVEHARAAADKAIAGRTGVARSCRARKR